MIFLRDRKAASEWRGGDVEDHGLFTLPEAVEFGAGFFVPLVRD